MPDFSEGGNEKRTGVFASRTSSENLVDEFNDGTKSTAKSSKLNPKNSTSRRNKLKQLAETNEVEPIQALLQNQPVELEPLSIVSENTVAPQLFSTKMRVESQLGKGIIKPHSVEIGVDGFHFKYDEPKPEVIKPEQFVSRTKEFHTNVAQTSVDKESDFLEWQETVKFVSTEDKELSLVDLAQVEEALEQEMSFESATEMEDNLAGIVIEDLLKEDIEAVEEPQLELVEVVEAEWNEPEDALENILEDIFDKSQEEFTESMLGSNLEAELLWSGNEMKWGIPFGKRYQITSEAVLIKDTLAMQPLKFSLASITNVELFQSWFDKLFGVGNIKLKLSDHSCTNFTLEKVIQPQLVYELIGSLIKQK